MHVLHVGREAHTSRLDAIAYFRVKPSISKITVAPGIFLTLKPISKCIHTLWEETTHFHSMSINSLMTNPSAHSNSLAIFPLCFKLATIGEMKHSSSVKPSHKQSVRKYCSYAISNVLFQPCANNSHSVFHLPHVFGTCSEHVLARSLHPESI